jgi:hypothetical protein
MKLHQDGAERAGTSKPARAGQIPASEINALNEAFEAIKDQADNEAADPDKRRLIALLELPDPERLPEMYRLYGPIWDRRLLVVWGGLPVSAPANASIQADLAAKRLAFAPLAAASLLRGRPVDPPRSSTEPDGDGDAKHTEGVPRSPSQNNRGRWALAAFIVAALLLALLALWFFTRPDEEASELASRVPAESSDPQVPGQSSRPSDGAAPDAGGDSTAPAGGDTARETQGGDNRGQQPGPDQAQPSRPGQDPDNRGAQDAARLEAGGTEANPPGQGETPDNGVEPGPPGSGQERSNDIDPGRQGSGQERPPGEAGAGPGTDQPAGSGQPAAPDGATENESTRGSTGDSPGPTTQPPQEMEEPAEDFQRGAARDRPGDPGNSSAGTTQEQPDIDQRSSGSFAEAQSSAPSTPVRPDISQGRVSTLSDGRAEIELFAAPQAGSVQRLNGRWSLGENSEGAELVGAATGQVRLRALPRDEPYQVIYTDGSVSRVVDVNIGVNATTEDR